MPTPKSQAAAKVPANRVPVAEVKREVQFPEMYMMLCAGDGKMCKGRTLYDEEAVRNRVTARFEGVDISAALKASLTEQFMSLLSSSLYSQALSVEDARLLLDWEDEPSYTAKVVKANREIKEKNAIFTEWLLKDVNGIKINCWNNSRNRPFDEATAYKYAQEILNGEWAPEGPNGETIIIGITGLVLSGQHRLIGLILAEQMRLNSIELQKRWPQPLTMDTAISFGVSESQKSVSTLDNVKPRTLADILYTSDVFRGLNNYQRREVTRMLDYAVDFLWLRTGQGKTEGHRYQTHMESQGFLDRHPHLLDAVKWIFDHNQDRQLSKIKLSPGQCAACLYLMGSAKSAGPVYHGQTEPSERGLDWHYWERACKFWKDLAAGRLGAVVAGIGSAIDDAAKLSSWKQVLLAKAWNLYAAGKDVTVDSIQPEQVTDDSSGVPVRHLAEWPGFGGIDLGPKKTTATEPSETEPAPQAPARPTAAQLQQKIDAGKAATAAPKASPAPAARAQATAPKAPATRRTSK